VTELEADARILAAELDVGLASPEGDGRTIPAGGILVSFDLPLQEDLERIGLPAARERARGAGVVVAVLDSGVLPGHEALAGRLAPGGWDYVDDDAEPWEERNELDDDENGFVDEGWGHGTFATSLVLAVAPEARVLPIRVLGSDGFGTSSAVAAGIMRAVNAGADVIHLSVALPAEVQIVREAVEQARALGVVVVASAGNTGEEDVGSAEAASGAFLVTALDRADQRASFASYGPGVALSAPGVDLHGAYPWEEPDTAIWSGTSFSAPLASGAFALLMELYPLLPADALMDRLRATAADVAPQNPGFEGRLGAGRLDLDAATR
jgi:subtilisin family serine protease